MKRKIIAVTGARSEYDILSPLLHLLNKDEAFELSVIATGSHLSEKFGNTIQFIQKDGFKICEQIKNLDESNEKIARIISLGNQINPLAKTFEREKPDLVIVVGDREEAITVAIVCAYMDIAVAHIAGGDIAKDGNIDNSTRYAASKYAHLHFTILEEHKNTLLKLGEDDWRIFTVGNPALDKFISTLPLSLAEINSKLKSNIPDDFCLVIYHPIITEFEKEKQHAKTFFSALRKSGKYFVINSPNSDAGHDSIMSEIENFKQEYLNIYQFKNLERDVYVNLMRHAKMMIGNSSSGIIEAPSLGLPVINVGQRQRGRFHANNVTFVDVDEEQILNAIKNITDENEIKNRLLQCPNPYGNGNSSEKIIEVLKSIKIDSTLLHKNITY
jgi:GDP/UDP-N,N'-diacetylbacillosamine 2-epimerase (hydrolysing)